MPEKLKIAFYSDTFLPAHDGVVTSILNFKHGLQDRGHEVYLFAAGNLRTRHLVGGEENVFIVNGISYKKYPQYNFALFPYLTSRKINEVNMDIIHAHTPFFMGFSSLVIAKLNKIPIVGTFHTMFTEKTVIDQYASSNKLVGGIVLKYAWPYARFFYNRCNLVTAPTDTIRKILAEHGIGNALVVPNSVDLEKFNPKVDGSDIRYKLLRKKGNSLVLYVGRLSREKKLETLLKAMRHLRDKNVEAVIVGTGPAERYYHLMAKKLKLNNVKFTGFVSDEELPRYYAAADAFCIPSIFETQGVVSLEAMAIGKPVIGADFLALSELIKEGKNGEKFVPGDSVNCAKKIEKVINNMGTYNTMLKTAAEFSTERATDKLLDTYKKAIDNMTLS